jgi:hypothetical protein
MSDISDDESWHEIVDVNEHMEEPEFVQLKDYPDFEISKFYPWIIREIATGRIVAQANANGYK